MVENSVTVRVIITQTNLVLDCVLFPFLLHRATSSGIKTSEVHQIQIKGNRSPEERSGLTIEAQSWEFGNFNSQGFLNKVTSILWAAGGHSLSLSTAFYCAYTLGDSHI